MPTNLRHRSPFGLPCLQLLSRLFSFSLLLSLALATLLSAASPTPASAMYDPTTYNVNKPTFVNDNFTPAQKDAQRAAGKNMMEALVSAAKSGAASYTIKPGTYRVPIATYVLTGISNFTVNCPNVNIWLDLTPSSNPQVCFTWLAFDYCTNIKVMGGNTNFDSEQLQFIQATITALNPAAGTMDVKVMPGYDAVGFPATTEGNMNWTFSRKGICLTRPSYSSVVNLDASNPTVKRLTVGTQFFANPSGKLVHVGDIFFTRHNMASWSAVVGAWRSSTNFEIDGINSWYGPMWVIDCTGGSFICRNCSNYRRPGTNRLGGSAEPFIYGNMHTLVWDGCTSGGPGQDDGIDVVGEYDMVAESTGPHTLLLPGSYPVGDTLYFYDPVTFAPEGQAKVVSSAPFTDTAHTADLITALNQKQSSLGAIKNYDTGQPFWTVTLDTDLTVSQFSGFDSDSGSPDVTITNSYFADMNSSSLFVKGHHIVVTGNRIDRGNGTAIHAQISRIWREGPVPQNVTITNNIINDNPCSYGDPNGIWSWALASITAEIEGSCSGVGAIHNVQIVGNTLSNSARVGIMLKNVDGAEVQNNTITAPARQPIQGAWTDWLAYGEPLNGAIFVGASRNVGLSGNLLVSPTPNVPHLLELGPYNELGSFSGSDYTSTSQTRVRQHAQSQR